MLNVFIGYGCNLKCGYCLQAPARDRAGVPTYKNKATSFVEKMLPHIIKNNIKEIAYWGGEPLLYWKTIEDIHNELQKHIQFKHVKIVTNGTLLTGEIKNTINNWGAYVVLSRHKQYGEPKWQFVKDIRNVSISFLFNGKELNFHPFLKELDELEKKTGRRFSGFMHWVRATDGCSPEYYIKMEQLDEHEKNLWELANLALKGNKQAIELWTPHIIQWEESFKGEFVPMCRGSHQIDVDLDGNLHNCHHSVNSKSKIGKAFGEIENMDAYLQAERFVKTTECQTCPIRKWCRGNCHLSNTHEVDCQLSKRKSKILEMLSSKNIINNKGNIHVQSHI
jgi:radical SAM protein with 4Fe4S-binding SPASM domain